MKTRMKTRKFELERLEDRCLLSTVLSKASEVPAPTPVQAPAPVAFLEATPWTAGSDTVESGLRRLSANHNETLVRERRPAKRSRR